MKNRTLQKDNEKVKLELLKIAKVNCKHCHGTGYIGKNVKTDRYVICSCAFKKLEQYRVNKLIKEKEAEK
jgi:hypothetical protein